MAWIASLRGRGHEAIDDDRLLVHPSPWERECRRKPPFMEVRLQLRIAGIGIISDSLTDAVCDAQCLRRIVQAQHNEPSGLKDEAIDLLSLEIRNAVANAQLADEANLGCAFRPDDGTYADLACHVG